MIISDLVQIELSRHKLRTGLTILGVVIGIVLILTMASLSEGIRLSIDEQMSFISGIVTVLDSDVNYATMMASEIDESFVEEIRAIPGVKKAAGIVYVNIQGNFIFGFNSDELKDIMSVASIGFTAGDYFEKDTNEIILGADIAKKNRYALGDIIKIRETDYEVVGIMESSGSYEDDNGIGTSLSIAQEITRKPDKVTMIFAKPENVEKADKIAEEINKLSDDLNAFTDKDAQKQAEQFVGQINMMTYSMGGIASIISAVVIMNVMFMSVRERTRQIGAMKALGATNTQILLQIIGESVIITSIGGLIGISLSLAGVRLLNNFMGSDIATLTPRLAIGGMLFAMLLGLIGGILPARQAYKLDPVVALRYE